MIPALTRRLLPHPYLTLLLTAVWVLLINGFSLGTIVFGLLLGIVVPLITTAYWPDRPVLRNWPMIIEYTLVVLWDIVLANINVARIILFKRNDRLHPAWITVPLDLRTPEAITVLAGTITMTPGTVSADVSADGRALLVHCLDLTDAEAVRNDIKTRYERRLMEIFE